MNSRNYRVISVWPETAGLESSSSSSSSSVFESVSRARTKGKQCVFGQTLVILAALCCAAVPAFAASPAQVRQRLAAGEQLTFVDVRSTVLFQKGHLPGAINVPSGLVPFKELPPLGRVVVYDDGLGPKLAEAAAAALNKKPGIQAEVLDGGFAVWESGNGTTTRPRGMQTEELPVITYARLKETQSSEVVLVDLRKSPETKAGLKAADLPALTDLRAEFPKARIVHSPFDASAGTPQQAKAGAAATPPLLVLIDRNDGAAAAMARTLKANGNTRFVILAGGEEILARQGERGLQRVGSTITVRRPAPAPAQTPPTP